MNKGNLTATAVTMEMNLKVVWNEEDEGQPHLHANKPVFTHAPVQSMKNNAVDKGLGIYFFKFSFAFSRFMPIEHN